MSTVHMRMQNFNGHADVDDVSRSVPYRRIIKWGYRGARWDVRAKSWTKLTGVPHWYPISWHPSASLLTGSSATNVARWCGMGFFLVFCDFTAQFEWRLDLQVCLWWWWSSTTAKAVPSLAIALLNSLLLYKLFGLTNTVVVQSYSVYRETVC